MDEPNTVGELRTPDPGQHSAQAFQPHATQLVRAPRGSSSRWARWVLGALSALVPGLGQLAAGRIGDAALFVFAFCWTRLFFAGLAADGEHLSAALGGAFGMARGFAMPTAVVFTVIAIALHVFASWDAARSHGRAGGRRSPEVGMLPSQGRG